MSDRQGTPLTREELEEKLYNAELRVAELTNEMRLLNKMLDIAWGAVTEAGYKGYSRKLKSFMEQDDGT